MLHFLERIGFVRKESNSGFAMGPAVIMMLLMLGFVGTTVYILISSLAS
jgi:hypothetical protein